MNSHSGGIRLEINGPVANLIHFRQTGPEVVRGAWTRAGQRASASLAALPQTTVAVLSGSAYGGGLELALHCDFRIAASHVEIGLPETTLGTTAGYSVGETSSFLNNPSWRATDDTNGPDSGLLPRNR